MATTLIVCVGRAVEGVVRDARVWAEKEGIKIDRTWGLCLERDLLGRTLEETAKSLGLDMVSVVSPNGEITGSFYPSLDNATLLIVLNGGTTPQQWAAASLYWRVRRDEDVGEMQGYRRQGPVMYVLDVQRTGLDFLRILHFYHP